jgi:uncharacterized membrane protein
MENDLKNILEFLYIAIGSIGVGIILWGVLIAIFSFLKLEFSKFKDESIYRERESIRHHFASYLLLALEFLIAADIIITVIHPTFEEIGILASIVAIRTVISYFLEKEIREFNKSK